MTTDKEEPETICQRGEAIYETKLRATLDMPENRGKILTIEPESGYYEINADLLQAMRLLRACNNEKRIYAMRIGHETLGHLRGGRVLRK